MSEVLGPLPEGDRFADILKFRRLGTGGGDQLYECWGSAVLAYAAGQVAAERERIAALCLERRNHFATDEAAHSFAGLVVNGRA